MNHLFHCPTVCSPEWRAFLLLLALSIHALFCEYTTPYFKRKSSRSFLFFLIRRYDATIHYTHHPSFSKHSKQTKNKRQKKNREQNHKMIQRSPSRLESSSSSQRLEVRCCPSRRLRFRGGFSNSCSTCALTLSCSGVRSGCSRSSLFISGGRVSQKAFAAQGDTGFPSNLSRSARRPGSTAGELSVLGCDGVLGLLGDIIPLLPIIFCLEPTGETREEEEEKEEEEEEEGSEAGKPEMSCRM